MTVQTPKLNTLCISCLEYRGRSKHCCQCGYDERQYKKHPLYLKPRTLLKNQYVIGNTLGQGGFGITYIGLDLWLQKKVAIKEYLPAALATRDVLTSTIMPLKKQEQTFNQGLQLFIDEARHLAKFDHPNIVRVINFFEDNKTGYMVMDYLEGVSPMDILNQTGGRLSVDEALAIILPVLDALAEVHAQHIYHRDISSQNIRILKTGVPILVDFGAARHVVGEQSRSLDLVLKHGYSPLEQYSGKGKIGPWTDIYACGALLYLMMTGELPPAATDRVSEENLIAPTQRGVEISPTLNDAIMIALAMKFEDRFQTVQEFQAALLGNQPVTLNRAYSVPPPATIQPKSPYHKKRQGPRKIVPLIATTLLLMMSASLLFSFQPAQLQWATDQLTMPTSKNAYETYQQILLEDPNNAQAKAGLLTIAEHYLHLAGIAHQDGHLDESLAMIRQGLQVMPTHTDLLAYQHHLTDQQAQQQQAKARAAKVKQLLNQAAQLSAKLQLEAAMAVYQDVLTIEPNNQPARHGIQQLADKYMYKARTASRANRLSIINKGLALFPNHSGLLALRNEFNQEQLARQREREALAAQQRELEVQAAQQRQIKKWLTEAEFQLKALRLTTPSGNNAYETYQKIFALVPNHKQATAGLTKIADQYERLARIKRDNLQKNLALVEKGLRVLPTHAGLIAQRQTILQQMQRETMPKQQLSGYQEPGTGTGTNPRVTVHYHPHSENQEEPSISPMTTTEDTGETESQSRVFVPEQAHPNIPKPPYQESLVDNTVPNELATAQQYLEAAQFEAAIQTYKNVLIIAPGNRQAIIGLQQIAYRCEQLARFENQQGSLQKSLSLVEQGLAAYPTAILLELQGEIIRRLNHQNKKMPIDSQPPRLILTPSF